MFLLGSDSSARVDDETDLPIFSRRVMSSSSVAVLASSTVLKTWGLA